MLCDTISYFRLRTQMMNVRLGCVCLPASIDARPRPLHSRRRESAPEPYNFSFITGSELTDLPDDSLASSSPMASSSGGGTGKQIRLSPSSLDIHASHDSQNSRPATHSRRPAHHRSAGASSDGRATTKRDDVEARAGNVNMRASDSEYSLAKCDSIEIDLNKLDGVEDAHKQSDGDVTTHDQGLKPSKSVNTAEDDVATVSSYNGARPKIPRMGVRMAKRSRPLSAALPLDEL